MKPTNKSLLSLPVRQVSPIALATPSSGAAKSSAPACDTVPATAVPAGLSPAATPVATPAGPAVTTGTRQQEERAEGQGDAQPQGQPIPAARASTTLVGALICTSLALLASLTFIARSHLATLPLAASGLQPQPVVARRAQPAKLKIGVYKQTHNVEKWRRWARQQNVTFEAVQKSRDGEPHYVLYLCEQDPARVDQLKLDVARISGETPLLVRRASSASI
ncbi:hypothetical protein Q7I37_15095 [Aeromonas allosaccharophila]|uniref:hypothetical protein n=1 Tax=Aeromonas allosaccharophila TaxID=656 RepID=UPI0030041819